MNRLGDDARSAQTSGTDPVRAGVPTKCVENFWFGGYAPKIDIQN